MIRNIRKVYFNYYFAHFAGKLISNTLLVDVKTVAFTEVKESLGSLRPTEDNTGNTIHGIQSQECLNCKDLIIWSNCTVLLMDMAHRSLKI